MYHPPLPAFSVAVFVLEQLVLSNSFLMDGLDSLPVVFDNTPSSSLFTDDDEVSTTTMAETLPNLCATVAPPDGLSFTQEDTNLFSRRRRDSNPACLPPVNIGAETLHLFENPSDTLENILLPLNVQNPDDSSGSPGLSSENGEQGNDEDLNAQGWQPYRGKVHYEEPSESKTCKELTAHRGNFILELCCIDLYAGPLPFSPDRYYLEDYEQVDAWTRSNEDFAAVYTCAGTFMSNQEAVFKNSLPMKK